jgi:anti-sigma factor RsiW
MTTRDEMQQLHAFIDGQLDLQAQLEFEARMREDAALRAQVQALRQLGAALREGADYHTAPEAWRRRVVTAIGPPSEAPAKPRAAAAAAALKPWLGWRPLAAGAGMAAMLALSINWLWLQSSRDERVLGDVVASHVRSTVGQHLVDVASSDRHTVKPWLSSKLGFSPQVSELQQVPGSIFLGGRVDYVDGRPVAALVYRQGGHVLNSFLWPSHDKDRAPELEADRGFQIAHWSRAGMRHWVISDLNREEFTIVVRALEAADGDGAR